MMRECMCLRSPFLRASSATSFPNRGEQDRRTLAVSATTRPAMTEGHVVLAPAGGIRWGIRQADPDQPWTRPVCRVQVITCPTPPGGGTFGLGGAQQRVAGDDHVQDGLGQVRVEMGHRG